MRKKTIILLIIFISYIALCNYAIYVHRIKYEYWEVKDLIFFLGILNGVIVTLPLGAYLSYKEHKEDKERKELALLLVKNMIDRQLYKEYEALNETIALRLDSIKEELEDLTSNYLEVKK